MKKTLQPLEFLQAATSFPKFYWKSRDSAEVFAGYGVSKKFETVCGGNAFSNQACQGVWSRFPDSFFFSPVDSLRTPWHSATISFSLPHNVKRKDVPSFSAWKQQVKDALQKIEHDHFQKVVLARQTTLSFESAVDPYQVMRMLNLRGQDSTLFMLQIDSETAFVGASPEKLFHRHGHKIASEAVAGTKISQEKWSEKELREVEAVKVFLHQKLSTLCHDVHWSSLQNKPFGEIEHLCYNVEGSLNKDVADLDLIAHLHPTPALGGFPQQEALRYLEQIEPIHRGWYGSPLGLFSSQEADIAVAIRSALICGSQVHLFAGLGIVQGSDPLQEWEELDKKIAHFLRFL